MRVLHIRLRNFRGVYERAVSFQETGVTVVEGGNEVGKTSLFQGFDLLLEKLDSSRDQLVRSVKPVHVDVGPEVEAEIVAGEYRFTYQKRWLKNPRTVLTITAPGHESLTGREAHERVREIITSAVDEVLWKALRVQQEDPVRQADLTDNTALSRALDLAAGSPGSSVAEHVDLHARVQAEYERYFTPKNGNPTGEYRQAIQQGRDAADEMSRRKAALVEIQGHAEEHERLTRDLVDLRRQEAQHHVRLGELQERWSELENRRQQIDQLQQRAHNAELESELATGARDERRKLIGQIDDQVGVLAELRARHDDGQHALDHARVESAAADQSRDRLRDELLDAETLLTRISDDLEYLRDLAELDGLTQRRARAHSAIEGIASAEAEVAAVRLDESVLSQFEDAHERLIRAQAELEAASGTIHIEALTALAMEVDGVHHDLTEYQTVERQLGRSTELVIPGTVHLHVRPGSGERDLRQAADDAKNAFTALCERAHVVDLAEARTQLQRRREAERNLRSHRDALARELDDLTLDQVHATHGRLAKTTGEYLHHRTAEPPLPADIDVARTGMQQAQERVSGLRAELDAVAQEASRIAALVNERISELRLTEQQITDIEQSLAADREQLDGARRKEPDEELWSRVERQSTQATVAMEQWQSAADALAADDPDSVRLRLDNEIAVGTRLGDDITRIELDRAGLDALLQKGQGTQEEYDGAHARAAAAAQKRANLERRAQAAQSLHTTLNRHRDAAQRAYVLPFRKELVGLGRIVFGENLDVDVDDMLSITHRTLGGVTVPFEDLSSGAKEQLCLCARLACATLVDPSDGVPVVIDDALGYTDNDRLARLGAVFNASASHSQIIILTCMPERYRGIGNAQVVRLRPPSLPQPSDSADMTNRDEGVRRTQDQEPDQRPRAARAAAEAILEVLRAGEQALGKSEILARAGLDPESWSPAIRELRESGRVHQIGDRRGAKYEAT